MISGGNAMSFYPIYYITIACPDLETSRVKIEEYIAHGAKALQIDMPSKEPVLETPFIRENMKKALEMYKGYDVYLDFFREIREKYPLVEIHLVAYPDVVESIGREKFVAFCKETGIASFMPVSPDPEYRRSFKRDGLVVIESMDVNLSDEGVERAVKLHENEVITINYKRHRECLRENCATLKDQVEFLRSRGVKARIYAVEGIADAGMMKEARDAGINGAFIGNILMRLWEDEVNLWKLFEEFQRLAVS